MSKMEICLLQDKVFLTYDENVLHFKQIALDNTKPTSLFICFVIEFWFSIFY